MSSNIPEDEHPMWVANTNYGTGDRVIYEHVIYEAILNHTSSTPPDVDVTHWLRIGATNRYRMFDGIISSESSRTGMITFTLRPSQLIDSISFLEVNAATINVTMNDPVFGEVYNQTQTLTDYSTITDVYAYFFDSVGETMRTSLFLDLPVYPSADVIVTIDAGSGIASVGEVIYGTQRIVGKTKYGSGFGIKSFSRKETDEFGNTIVVKRKNAKVATYDIEIENTNLARLQRFFSDIDSTPCVFVGVADDIATYEPFVVYGFYLDFNVTVGLPQVSMCNLRVEGLI